MMKILSLVNLAVCLCFAGCSAGDNTSAQLQNITILDKGAVAPYQISTTIRIEAGNIVRSDSQSGQVIGEWSKQMQFSDFSSARAVVSKFNLMDQPTITLAADQQPCSGWSGMSIAIQNEQSLHAFDISGLACDRNRWPDGPRELVNLQDNLVAKYFCSNPAPVLGKKSSTVAGYMVSFNPGVNAQTEAGRLATEYGFKVLAVYDIVEEGFFSDFSTTVLEQLRCEPSIKNIEFNQILSAVN
jgi:hypothetical protein